MNHIDDSSVHVRAISVDGADGTLGPLSAYLYAPGGTRPGGQGLIVFFPCGGFVTSEASGDDPFMRMLALRTGFRILISSYTLPKTKPFPAAIEDAHAVLAWAAENRALLGWNGKQLITAGVEAGGNLAAVSALMARDRGSPALAAQILIMPMLDPGLSSCSMRAVDDTRGAARAAHECAAGYRDYLPRAIDRAHPYASPLQASRLKGLPPALILSAADDPLRDEAELYGARLAAAGIRTTIKRLPPMTLENPDARQMCVRHETALQELDAFIATLNIPRRQRAQKSV